MLSPLLKVLFAPPFLSRKGAKPSAASGRYSEAQHGQNKEKPNKVQVLTMFCPWSKWRKKRNSFRIIGQARMLYIPVKVLFGPFSYKKKDEAFNKYL